MSKKSGVPVPLQSCSHSSGIEFPSTSALGPSLTSQPSAIPFSLQSGSSSSGKPFELQSTMHSSGSPFPSASVLVPEEMSQESGIKLALQSGTPPNEELNRRPRVPSGE